MEPGDSSQITMTRTELFRLNNTVERDPGIDSWMAEHSGELGAIAQKWPFAIKFGIDGGTCAGCGSSA